MGKRDTWRQTNPKDQMIVLLGAIEGHLSNMKDYTTPPEYAYSRIIELLEQVSELSNDYLIEKW